MIKYLEYHYLEKVMAFPMIHITVHTGVPTSCQYGTYRVVPSCIEYADTWYTGIYWCTIHIDPLSDPYIPPVPNGMFQYVKP